jgi:hypothetical protein
MSHDKHYQTAPEDRIPFIQKVIFGAGAFVNNILAYAFYLRQYQYALGSPPTLYILRRYRSRNRFRDALAITSRQE